VVVVHICFVRISWTSGIYIWQCLQIRWTFLRRFFQVYTERIFASIRVFPGWTSIPALGHREMLGRGFCLFVTEVGSFFCLCGELVARFLLIGWFVGILCFDWSICSKIIFVITYPQYSSIFHLIRLDCCFRSRFHGLASSDVHAISNEKLFFE